jgi:hypothetical protein
LSQTQLQVTSHIKYYSCLLAQIIVEDSGAGREMIGTETAIDILEGVVGAAAEVAMMKAVDVRADRVALETENDIEAPVSLVI